MSYANFRFLVAAKAVAPICRKKVRRVGPPKGRSFGSMIFFMVGHMHSSSFDAGSEENIGNQNVVGCIVSLKFQTWVRAL